MTRDTSKRIESFLSEVAWELGGRKATLTGSGWQTCCPAHADENPSLSITVLDGGKLLAHCHAGCAQEQVLDSLRGRGIPLNLQSEEATPRSDDRSLGNLLRGGYKIAAIYRYCDMSGAALYENIRLEQHDAGGRRLRKTFRQRRRAPDGRWIYNLRGQRQVPYRVNELAAQPGANIHVAEGEKDADRLRTLGLVATSIATAASVDLTALRDRVVFIHEDNDDAGRKKANSLADAVASVAHEVHIVSYTDAPPAGDVSDWLDLGHDLSDLNQRLSQARKHELLQAKPLPYVARCLADVEFRPVEWLWPERLARGKVSILAGQPGVGKSQVCAMFAATVTTGRKWPDESDCQHGSVIVISCEDDAADTLAPRHLAAGADLGKIHTLDWIVKPDKKGNLAHVSFDLQTGLVALRSLIDELGDVALVVIDPISAYLGRLDSHKSSDVRAALAPLQTMAAETGVAVVLVSHLNKGSADMTPLARVAGSLAFVAAARAAYLVERDPEDPEAEFRLLVPLKNNLGNDKTGFRFKIESIQLNGNLQTSRVNFDGEPITITASAALGGCAGQPEPSCLATAVEFLGRVLRDEPKTSNAVKVEADALGISGATLRRARENLGVKVWKARGTGQSMWSLSAPDAVQFNQLRAN